MGLTDIASRVVALLTRDTGSVDNDPTPGPEVTYIGVLDGETLWLAVAGISGTSSTLALREQQSNTLIEMPTDAILVGGDLTLSVRFDLLSVNLAVPKSGSVRFRVVVVDSASDEPVPVRAAPQPNDSIAKAPTTCDGGWQFSVVVDGGVADIVREPRTPGAPASRFAATDDAISFHVDVPEASAATLLVVNGQGRVFHTIPIDADGRVSLNRGHLPEVPGSERRLAVGAPEAPVPVVRPRNDLLAPNAAVSLPRILGAGGDVDFQLRWIKNGRLVLAAPSPGASGDDGSGASDVSGSRDSE